MMKIETTINGESKILDIDPASNLADVLRREGYFGVKIGCSNGNCGTCTVLVDGIPMKSCMMFAAQAHKREITTIEGIGNPNNPHPLQKAFAEEGGTQCGFCVPGMILSAKALLDRNPNPSEEEIKTAINGNLCRCTGYVKQIKAIKKAAEEMRGKAQ